MTDKEQKIKEWICKEQNGLMDAQGNFEYTEHEGAYHILCTLDAYIDSLQVEPVSEGLEEAANNAVIALVPSFGQKYSDGSYVSSCRDCFNREELLELFKAGANWQKQKYESYIKSMYKVGINTGKELMKQQLMAKAVDATVHIDAGGYPYIPQMELYDYDNDIPLAKEGDKYKVILIKED